jgi:cytochrome c oxidase cbb3-type subunit 4
MQSAEEVALVASILEFLHSFWMLWAMVLFSGIVVWAYWPRNKAKLESYGRIPLNDDGNEER